MAQASFSRWWLAGDILSDGIGLCIAVGKRKKDFTVNCFMVLIFVRWKEYYFFAMEA